MLGWAIGIGVLLALLAFLVWASASIASGVYVKEVCRLATKQKVIALTFDDGPTEHTSAVLDTLARHGIKAAFFCIGHKAQAMPEMVKRMDDEGHLIGNHSYSHTWRFPLLSARTMLADVERCSAVLEQTVGAKPLYFRPPFGVTNPTIAKMLNTLRLTSVGWNVRSLDTTTTDVAHILKRVEKQLTAGSIVLLHDSLAHSPQVLEGIVQLAKDKGYTFARVDEYMNSKKN